ncbi:unnamed protein product [Acanthoscelides obtectus]|uniref:Uncharacterized protein n=1 Tax=Acanthoscelides obtectus TaxID=200917 RepID=A0A9P0PJ25_ACAOB|nr:unnamed protein product [Acanthoscelides obtectus]CAK1654593.1 hypothetical protein AOBTE_LOCUS18699 [Acanthoscelides obtectus]
MSYKPHQCSNSSQRNQVDAICCV